VLGAVALGAIKTKLDAMRAEIDAGEAITLAADYPKAS
jgi:hypothetical protein